MTFFCIKAYQTHVHILVIGFQFHQGRGAILASWAENTFFLQIKQACQNFNWLFSWLKFDFGYFSLNTSHLSCRLSCHQSFLFISFSNGSLKPHANQADTRKCHKPFPGHAIFVWKKTQVSVCLILPAGHRNKKRQFIINWWKIFLFHSHSKESLLAWSC